MPIVFRERVNEFSELGVWKITESIEELYAQLQLNSEEKIFFESLQKGKRVLQWLSSRVLLRKMLNAQDFIDFRIDGHQKPYLYNYPYHISISHTIDYASVITSSSHLVGVDIEEIQDKIERVDFKFLSESELSFLNPKRRVEHLYACWSAKEALYKLHGKKEVSFKDNIMLQPFEIADAGELEAIVNKDDFYKRLRVFYMKYDTCMLAWATD